MIEKENFFNISFCSIQQKRNSEILRWLLIGQNYSSYWITLSFNLKRYKLHDQYFGGIIILIGINFNAHIKHFANFLICQITLKNLVAVVL